MTDGLAGISVPEASVKLRFAAAAEEKEEEDTPAPAAKGKRKRKKKSNTAFEASGPCLITHKGLSGPACLRLSAFAARELSEHAYKGELLVNWVGSENLNEESALVECRGYAARSPKQHVGSYSPVGLPKRLWANLVASAGVSLDTPWAAVSKGELRSLAKAIVCSTLPFVGKSTNKDEFVTAGGADLKDFSTRTFECKRIPGLFLAGEVLNVDGITGGYNFLNAWSTSHHAGEAIAEDANSLHTAGGERGAAEAKGSKEPARERRAYEPPRKYHSPATACDNAEDDGD